jgi:transcriptional regulator with XRE-family HTH domain
MKNTGNKIREMRKSKGLSQEDLADLAKVNLRTIQRIENNKSEPRGNTLKLISGALQTDLSSLGVVNGDRGKLTIHSILVNGFFLVLFNTGLMLVLGFSTLDSNANPNSKFAGILLSFFVSFFVVYMTPKMKGIERLWKFGSGMIIYFFLLLIIQGTASGIHIGVRTGLYLCVVIITGVLYYGDYLLKMRKK